MSYVLEVEEEFDRLEWQSTLPAYDFTLELQGVEVEAGARVLDAGCGSGAVSRYLAETQPASSVYACDCSPARIAQARHVARAIQNLQFDVQDLTKLAYPDNHFDLIISRFVVEHLSPTDLRRVIAEMTRVLKPAGRLLVIDADGVMHGLYPQTPRVAIGLKTLLASMRVDLHVGRKIPQLLAAAGLTSIDWRVDTMSFQGALKEAEISLMRERFKNAASFFQEELGGAEAFQRFREEYLECMAHPQAVVFFNKFVVQAVKPVAGPTSVACEVSTRQGSNT